MSILSNHKKLEEKKEAVQSKEQMEMAQKLIKLTDETMDFLKDKDLQVWEVNTIISLLSQKLKQLTDNFTGMKTIKEITPDKTEDKTDK